VERRKALDQIRSLSFRLKLDPSVLAERADLQGLQVLRDSKEFAVKLASPDPLALQEVVDREVYLVFPAKMVILEKMVNLDRLVLLDLRVLEVYRECPVCLGSRVIVVSPVWTAPKENLDQVAKKERKV